MAMNSIKYKHIFIDLDKTLWDFDRNSLQTLQDIFEKHDLSSHGIPCLDDFLPVYKRNNHNLWELYRKNGIEKEELNIKRFDISLQEWGIINHNLASDIAHDYVNLSPKKTNLYPGTIDGLEYLKQKYSLHLITNGFEEVQQAKLDNCNLRHFFNSITTSEEAGVKKPEKEIFMIALQKARANIQESIMIGDDMLVDIAGARNTGMDQILFNPDNSDFNEDVTYEMKSWKDIASIL